RSGPHGRTANDTWLMFRLALPVNQETYFQTRFVPDPRRESLWRALWRYHFAHLVAPTDCVLDLGAGYGCFINEVVATRKIAIDSWNGFVNFLHPGIEGRVCNVTDLSFLASSSVNFVFASNLFEHVSQEDFASVLCQLKRILTPNGTINILQPN